MHILANGAGKNLRSTITNHLNILDYERTDFEEDRKDACAY